MKEERLLIGSWFQMIQSIIARKTQERSSGGELKFIFTDLDKEAENVGRDQKYLESSKA